MLTLPRLPHRRLPWPKPHLSQPRLPWLQFQKLLQRYPSRLLPQPLHQQHPSVASSCRRPARVPSTPRQPEPEPQALPSAAVPSSSAHVRRPPALPANVLPWDQADAAPCTPHAPSPAAPEELPAAQAVPASPPEDVPALAHAPASVASVLVDPVVLAACFRLRVRLQADARKAVPPNAAVGTSATRRPKKAR